MTPEKIVDALRTYPTKKLQSVALDAADLIERQAKALEAERAESDHFAKLAAVDMGANPVVTWKERAESAETKCERQAKALEKAENIAKVAWITFEYGQIADADYGNALCEHIAATIRALKVEGE